MIAGLCEGIKAITSYGLSAIAEYESSLFTYALEMLCNIPEISVYAPSYKGATMLFNAKGIPSEELALLLDSYGICTRGGFHCSALAHKTLGTASDGALRVSLGIFNQKKDIDSLAKSLSAIISEKSQK